MAERGQLPRISGALHPRFNSPWFSILLSAVVMLVLTLEGSFISCLSAPWCVRVVVRFPTDVNRFVAAV